MKSIDEMAREAGFMKDGETALASASQPDDKAFGMDVVSAPLMPEGFAALRTERGAMVMGPKGSFWVPFWPNV